MRPHLLAGAAAHAMSFAHFAGIGTGKKTAARADDTDETKDKDESAEDPERDESAEDPEKDREDMAAAGADDGDDEDDKPAASTDDGDGEDDEDEDDKPPKDSKKAKGQGARRNPPSAEFKKGRKAERRRCAAIFGHAAAAKNPALACHLAFNTGMSSAHAIDCLQKAPTAATAASSRRAEGNPRIGPDGARTDPGKQAEGLWDRAHAKAGPRSPAGAAVWDNAHGAARR